MGGRTLLGNRFTAAREYLEQWDDYKKAGAGDASGRVAPRRNLELEALGEVLQGKRWVHCHSYRQDEVLAFLRTLEGVGGQGGTLQHILEGYKVADEIARHGAGASTFADWWAYKFEVYDAIPYNGSLMRERGVLVSFNSDSSDLDRGKEIFRPRRRGRRPGGAGKGADRVIGRGEKGRVGRRLRRRRRKGEGEVLRPPAGTPLRQPGPPLYGRGID